jgi:hypothetical protein
MRPALLLACFFVACAHPRIDANAPPSLEDTLNTVEGVDRVGQAISAKDDASSAATDVLFALQKRQALPPLAGWITVPEGAHWRVRFIRSDLDVPSSAVDILLGGAQPQVTLAPAGGETLPPEQAAMWRARKHAIQASPPRCGKNLNPVVLNASLVGQKGWLVYLLNPATREGQIVIGGHVRVFLSPDGERVLDTFPLSNSCLVLGGDDAQGRATVAAFTTQLDGDVPHETTVAESLRSKKEVFVMTRNGKAWTVSKGHVSTLK